MKILLFGGEGQLGTRLKNCLLPLGQIRAPDRIEVDLSRVTDLRDFIHSERPELIVNAAAYTAVDQAESEEELAMRVNADAPAVMAQVARQCGALLVHYSTDYVFDGNARVSYDETAPTTPINAYGRSKLAGENAVRSSGAANLILRTAWLYSNRGRNFLNTMLKLGIERKHLRVVNDQTGAPTYADLVANATAQIIPRMYDETNAVRAELSGTYHITCQGSATWYDFARRIFALVDMEREITVEPITTANYPTPARRPAYSVLSCEKLARVFGLRLPPWQEALRQCLAARSTTD